MCLSVQHLLASVDESEDLINRIVTGVKHVFITTNPNQSEPYSSLWFGKQLIQEHYSSPTKHRLMAMPSAGNAFLTVVWDSQRLLLTHFLKRGEIWNVTSSVTFCQRITCRFVLIISTNYRCMSMAGIWREWQNRTIWSWLE